MTFEQARRLRLWLGVGVPTLVAAVLAAVLGIPVLLVLGFVAVVAIGLVFGS